MKWKKVYETGIKKVDDDHKVLVQLTDELEAAMEPGASREAMGATLKALVEYVKFHFNNEEEVMKRVGFPDLQRHRQLHKDLVNDVAGILIDLKNGKEWTKSELIGFLTRWLEDHILGEDQKIGQFLGSI